MVRASVQPHQKAATCPTGLSASGAGILTFAHGGRWLPLRLVFLPPVRVHAVGDEQENTDREQQRARKQEQTVHGASSPVCLRRLGGGREQRLLARAARLCRRLACRKLRGRA